MRPLRTQQFLKAKTEKWSPSLKSGGQIQRRKSDLLERKLPRMLSTSDSRGKEQVVQDVVGLEGVGHARGVPLVRSCTSKAGEAQSNPSWCRKVSGKVNQSNWREQNKHKCRIWMGNIQNLKVTELTLSHKVHYFKYKSEISSRYSQEVGIWRAIPNDWSLLPSRSQPATASKSKIGIFLSFLSHKPSFLKFVQYMPKMHQHHNHPEKKRQALQRVFQNMKLSFCVSVELIPSLVLGKLGCWKDNLSCKKYNQNLDHLLFSDYLMII